jgi:pyruvate formate lyase activating enzyme
VWVEVTTLLIPDENDDEGELCDLAAWLAALGPDIPWHISRFRPDYKMRDHPPTPVGRIHRAVEIGREAGLHYVYAGNVPGDQYEHTRCPVCGTVAIERFGYRIRNKLVAGNQCPRCGAELAIVAA